MYYNIKIKAGNGTYCLECQNKEITQREMDLYFGIMFGASKEFMDSIKDIVIPKVALEPDKNLNENAQKPSNTVLNYAKPNTPVSDNLQTNTRPVFVNKNTEPLRAIDEFDIIENPKQSKNQTQQKEITTDNKLVFKPSKIEEELVFEDDIEEELVFENDSNKQSLKNDEALSKNNQELQEIGLELEPSKKEESKTEQKKPDLEIVSIKEDKQTESKTNEFTSDKSQDNDTIDPEIQNATKAIEMIKKAIDKTDISSDDTFDIDIPDSYADIEEKSLKDIDLDNKEESIEEIIQESKEQEEVETIDTNYLNNITDEDKAETIVIDDKQDELEIIQSDEENNTATVEVEPKEEEVASIFSDDSNIENPPESQNIIAAKEYPIKNKEFNLDFKTFLANYNHNTILDEFLICAYYIKNIIKQDGFNMKFINSKLFQTTGNIADLSIVDSLIEGDYIKSEEIDGSKKYSITSSGEEYFMTTYQK